MTTQASNLHDTAGADPHAHAGHPKHLAHHFDSLQQQFDSAKVGMWVFLATEILMFGGLFVAYSVWRANHPEVFLYAHTELKWYFGFINTIFLITSSFTMAWGVRAAQLNQKGLCAALLIATLAGGFGFLGVKTIEYSAKYEHAMWVGNQNKFHPKFDQKAYDQKHGHSADAHAADAHAAAPAAAAPAAPATPAVTVPGLEVSKITAAPIGPAGVNSSVITLPPTLAADAQGHDHDGHDHAHDAHDGHGHGAAHGGKIAKHSLSYDQLTDFAKKHTHQFFQIYFLMTGLHTLHVIIGMGLIFWVLFRTMKGEFSSEYFTPVDLVGLYWHLVDLIWIFLFPLLYLIH